MSEIQNQTLYQVVVFNKTDKDGYRRAGFSLLKGSNLLTNVTQAQIEQFKADARLVFGSQTPMPIESIKEAEQRLLSEILTNNPSPHQRVTRFDITFADDIQENAPKLAKNTRFSALTEYANAINALSDEFAEQIAEINEFVDLLVDNPFTQLVDFMVEFIENTFESINSVVTDVGDIKTKAESMKNRMMNLIRAPSLLGKELQGLVQFKKYKGISPKQGLNQRAITTNVIHNTISEATKSKTEMPKAMFDAIVNAKRNNINATDILKRNATGLHQQEIAQALMTKAQFSCARLIISTLAVEYAKSVTEALTDSLSSEVQTIESKADIKALIGEIDSQLEQAILDNADAENWRSYQALEQFRLAVISDLRTRGEQLANIKSVHLSPSLRA
ncbi:64 kDa virion protein [Pasteurella multocida subsp. multocida OH4807]|nr:64 kDa virion protein [Pasteurella multocida subsp. multocida OH4807]